MKTTLFLGLYLALSTSANAQDVALHTFSDPYYQMSSFTSEVVSIEENEIDYPTQESFNSNSPDPAPTGSNPMSIATMALKVWDIIQKGAPVVNAKAKYASALPNLANGNWMTLTGWKTERTITYNASVKNGFGAKTVDFQYQVKLIYGGGVNGKGKYIASARVVPSKVDVMWGYNLDVSVEVPTVLNMGSEQDPLAAINLDITYKISTMMRDYSESDSYLLQGDGLLKNTRTNKTYFSGSL